MARLSVILIFTILLLTGSVSALEIAQWYPQGASYIFICDAEAGTYDWHFGDGEKLIDVTNKDVYHYYAIDSNFTATCAPHGSGDIESLQIDVRSSVPPEEVNKTHDVNISIHPWFPKGNDYIFLCDADYPASHYDWFFGDGTELRHISNPDVYHIFPDNSAYTVTCVAKLYGLKENASMTIGSGSGPIPNETIPTCLLDKDVSMSAGRISYDRTIGDVRHIVWNHPGNRAYWLEAKRDGGFIITRYFSPSPGTPSDGSICLGDACVSYTQNSTSTTACDAAEPSLGIRLYPGFPADYSTAFECVATGFTPDEYLFDFGDGTDIATAQYDVQHTYNETGTYTASCYAQDNGIEHNASMDVQITAPFPRSLINGTNNRVNATLSLNTIYSGGGDPALYIQLLNKSDETATVVCDAVNHRHLINQSNMWGFGVPGTVLSRTVSDAGETVTFRADPGHYTIGCWHALTEPQYSHGFWDAENVLYHHALFACNYQRPYACTGADTSLDIAFTAPPLPESCLLDGTPQVSSGWIEYDRTVGDERHFVWIEGPYLNHWITATRDGKLTLHHNWTGNLPYNTPDPDASFCLGGACVGPYDTAASVNSTCEIPPEETLSIRTYPGFPQDHKMVFECVATGFTPSSYGWDFGDGTTSTTLDYDEYHTYTALGTYEVSCSAGNLTASMDVTATAPFSPSLITADQVPINSTLTVSGNVGEQWGNYLQLVEQQGDEFTLYCGTIGHATDYPTSWWIPAGVEVISTSADTQTKVLRADPGTYKIDCSQGVRVPIYWSRFWGPSYYDNPDPNEFSQYHNALAAFRYDEPKSLTGYGASINVVVE